jgi:hypothetical protein
MKQTKNSDAVRSYTFKDGIYQHGDSGMGWRIRVQFQLGAMIFLFPAATILTVGSAQLPV